MTDETLNDDTADLNEPTPVAFDLDDWIDGGAVTEHSVPIYSRPDLAAVLEDWERRRKHAKIVAGDDEALGGESIEDLEAEGRAIYKQWIESKATWYVRALTPERLDELRAAANIPSPIPDLKSGNEAAKAKHAKRQEKRAKEIEAAAGELQLTTIAEAVNRIEGANGSSADGVTVEQLRRLRERLGAIQIRGLYNTAMLASLKEPELSPDFSGSTSRSDRT